MLTIENSHARTSAWAKQCTIALVCLLTVCGMGADAAAAETIQALPESFGIWRAEKNTEGPHQPAEFAHYNIKRGAVARLYASDASNDRLRVTLVQAVNDAGAYAFFTALRRRRAAGPPRLRCQSTSARRVRQLADAWFSLRKFGRDG
ncbi:MAG: hypothetical protein WKF30_00630 [Pyrinomonadaceae bacterium]